MSKPPYFPLENNLFYPLILERERNSRDSLPDILRDLNVKPRRLIVEQKTVTLPFGVSFSRTRLVCD